MKPWQATVLLAALIALPACGLGRPHPEKAADDEPDFAADEIDLAEDDSILDLLEPEERAAVDRAGVSGARPAREARAAEGKAAKGKADTAGKVGLSVLTVALSVGAAVAPFFLF